MSAINQRELMRHHRELLRRIGNQVAEMRQDVGWSQRTLAAAAGVSRSHLGEIETGDAEPGIEILERIAAALGADFGAKLFEGTGPALRDHTQTPMTNELLRVSRRTWAGRVEVVVTWPVHGVIDAVLEERRGPVTVVTELHGQLRRAEQQVRWQNQKAEALAAGEGQRGRTVSRLLVVRNSDAVRRAVRDAELMLAAAYPARTADAVAALRGDAAWPGAAIAWMNVDRGAAALMEGPPRGIAVGR